MTLDEYYSRLPLEKDKDIKMPELPVFYLVSGFTHPRLPIVRHDGLHLYEWGLIPSWIKDEQTANEIRNKTLNAVGDTAFDKPSFRKSIATQRCLLPINGFYEWRDINGLKYPYMIHTMDNEMFSLGAIYDTWLNRKTGELRNTFSIVTTPANPMMEKIHNLKKRMPLILPRENEIQWLDPDLKTERIRELIKPFPETKMSAYTISRQANNSGYNRNIPTIQDPVNYPELIEMENALF